MIFEGFLLKGRAVHFKAGLLFLSLPCLVIGDGPLQEAFSDICLEKGTQCRRQR